MDKELNWRFWAILNMNEKALYDFIKLYNNKLISDESRVALEAYAAFCEDLT